MAIVVTGYSWSNEQITPALLNQMWTSATFNSSAVDDSTTALSGGAVIVKDAGVVAAKLASNSVTTVKILDDNVTTAKILDDNVTFAKLADVLDSDTMTGASATKLATSESIKAYVDAAKTSAYRSSFVTCPTAGSSTSFSHSLGGVPDVVSIQLQCTKAAGSDGFANGEIVILSNSYAYNSYGVGVEINSTNVVFHVGSNGIILISPDGSYNTITSASGAANFKVKATAAIL